MSQSCTFLHCLHIPHHMRIIQVESSLCTCCGRCLVDCSPQLFQAEYEGSQIKSVQFADPEDICSRCGHCIALCPSGAIEYTEADPVFNHPLIRSPEKCSYLDVLALLRARRSIRHYKSKDVPRSEIEAVLEAMRYAPSASNRQNWRYIVLTNPARIQEIANRIMSVIIKIRRLFNFPLLKSLLSPRIVRKTEGSHSFIKSMDRLIKRMENGGDPIFFHAPCVIILYSPNYGKLAGNNAGIAFTYGMLAAQARGLGTCWIGFAQEAFLRLASLRSLLHLPRHYQVRGVMTLGYPDLHFLHGPPRNELNIRWE